MKINLSGIFRTMKMRYLFILSLLSFFGACDSSKLSDTDNLPSSEENFQDTLFLGYRFGMSRDEFFTHSWDLNKQGLVVNGSGAEIVQYTEELKSPTKKAFYPTFKDDKIVEMPVVYSYTGWAPWNTHLFADSLQTDLIGYISDSLNIEFASMDQPNSENKIYQSTYQGQRISIQVIDHNKVLLLYQSPNSFMNRP